MHIAISKPRVALRMRCGFAQKSENVGGRGRDRTGDAQLAKRKREIYLLGGDSDEGNRYSGLMVISVPG